MASGGGGKTTQTAASKAGAGKAAAAAQARAAAAKAAQIKALEAQMGGRPAWVDKFNQTYQGKYVISPIIDNGQLAYVTNNLQYYSPQGTYIHGADYGPKGLVDYIGEYLPIIETVALTLAGVPPAITGAAVSAANGGNIEQIAKAAIGGYIGGEVSSGVSSTVTSVGTSAGVNASVLKIASSAAGADAGTVASSLVQGKTIDQALKAGTAAAVGSVISSSSNIAGKTASGLIEDPTISKIAGAATSAGTAAALSGKDAGKAALTAGGKVAGGELLDRAGNVISDVASNVDLSSVKDTFKPVGEAIGKITQPISDVATNVLQPLEGPVKNAITTGGSALAGAVKPIGDAFNSAGNNIKPSTSGEDVLDKSIINLMAQTPGDTAFGPSAGTTVAGGPAISDIAGGAAASPAAFAGADVAMLGDTSEAGLGSKVSKKGGKYPWGEPEGTTALKEGLGIG